MTALDKKDVVQDLSGVADTLYIDVVVAEG